MTTAFSIHNGSRVKMSDEIAEAHFRATDGSDDVRDQYGTVVDGPWQGPGEQQYWLVRWDGWRYTNYEFENNLRVIGGEA